MTAKCIIMRYACHRFSNGEINIIPSSLCPNHEGLKEKKQVREKGKIKKSKRVHTNTYKTTKALFD